MLVHERHKKIIELLHEKKNVSVSMLIESFGVSFETIRRDLETLEKAGQLKRVHGGAVLEKVNNQELIFNIRKGSHSSEKAEIAQIACQYVKEGQSVSLDASSTNLEIAKALKRKFNKLTVITNSLVIASELSGTEKFQVFLTGGFLKHEELCMIGPDAEAALNNFHINTAFISVTGISLTQELTDFGFEEIQVKRKMMDRAQQKIIVADSSKFDVVSLLRIGGFEEVDLIITDSKLDKSILAKYKESKIKIINSSYT